MMHILDPLRSLQLGGTAFRVVLAVLFGGVVGMERGRKGRAAGMRTSTEEAVLEDLKAQPGIASISVLSD